MKKTIVILFIAWALSTMAFGAMAEYAPGSVFDRIYGFVSVNRSVIRLLQKWNMFAGGITNTDRTISAKLVMMDGSKIEYPLPSLTGGSLIKIFEAELNLKWREKLLRSTTSGPSFRDLASFIKRSVIKGSSLSSIPQSIALSYRCRVFGNPGSQEIALDDRALVHLPEVKILDTRFSTGRPL